jgi:hypothetical protein
VPPILLPGLEMNEHAISLRVAGKPDTRGYPRVRIWARVFTRGHARGRVKDDGEGMLAGG